jgi:hypothetical protein
VLVLGKTLEELALKYLKIGDFESNSEKEEEENKVYADYSLLVSHFFKLL